VLVIAVVVVLAMQALPRTTTPAGPAKPGSTTVAGILVPLTGTPTNIAFGRFLGRPDAPVHLIVWSDFQCANCRAFAETSQAQLIRDYVAPGNLRIEFRDLAIVSPESSAAAAAARCADQQNRFWPYHDVLFANQAAGVSGQLGPARLKDMADAIGLDRTKFDTCLPSGDLFNEIEAETAQGQARGDGQPLLDFGPVVLEGSPPYDQLKQTVDTLIANAPTPAPTPAATVPAATAPAPASSTSASP
jgi:protein-disulfide isomerase